MYVNILNVNYIKDVIIPHFNLYPRPGGPPSSRQAPGSLLNLKQKDYRLRVIIFPDYLCFKEALPEEDT